MSAEVCATAGAIFCNNMDCQAFEHGYNIYPPVPGVPEWLCRACLLKYIADGRLQLGPDSPAKTLAVGERHYLAKIKISYCYRCDRMCDLKLDDKPICLLCFIEMTTGDDFAIVTPGEAPDVVSADAEAPFEVAWE